MREWRVGRTKRVKDEIIFHFFEWQNDCQEGFLTVSAREDAVSLRKNARVFSYALSSSGD